MKHLKKFNENIKEENIQDMEYLNEDFMDVFQTISEFLSQIDAKQSIEISTGKTMSTRDFFIGVLGGMGVLGAAVIGAFPEECKAFGQKLLKKAGSIPKAVKSLINHIKDKS